MLKSKESILKGTISDYSSCYVSGDYVICQIKLLNLVVLFLFSHTSYIPNVSLLV